MSCHAWIQSMDLCDLTAGEELTSEEYGLHSEPSLLSRTTYCRIQTPVEQEAGMMSRTVLGPSQLHMLPIPNSSHRTYLVPARPLERGIPDNDNDPEVQLTNDDVRALRMIGDMSLF